MKKSTFTKLMLWLPILVGVVVGIVYLFYFIFTEIGVWVGVGMLFAIGWGVLFLYLTDKYEDEERMYSHVSPPPPY